MSRVPALASGYDKLRACALSMTGSYFLRAEPTHVPPPPRLCGDDHLLPSDWGDLNRRLYRMFHSTTLPTILRNFDRLSMAHGIEVRMPFMDWRLVTYTMALPDAAKNAEGYTKWIARRAMVAKMPESIRMEKKKVGFSSPMPEWLNGPLAPWVQRLLAKPCAAFDELVDGEKLSQTVRELTARKSWDWNSADRIWPYLHLKWLMTGARS